MSMAVFNGSTPRRCLVDQNTDRVIFTRTSNEFGVILIAKFLVVDHPSIGPIKAEILKSQWQKWICEWHKSTWLALKSTLSHSQPTSVRITPMVWAPIMATVSRWLKPKLSLKNAYNWCVLKWMLGNSWWGPFLAEQVTALPLASRQGFPVFSQSTRPHHFNFISTRLLDRCFTSAPTVVASANISARLTPDLPCFETIGVRMSITDSSPALSGLSISMHPTVRTSKRRVF